MIQLNRLEIKDCKVGVGLFAIVAGGILSGCDNSLQEQKAALKHASNLRVQKVISRLKEDCEASLRKETYKINQQLQQLKQRQTVRKKG